MAIVEPREIRWLSLDRATRRRVRRAVRAGAPATTRDDAALTTGYCAATLAWLSQPRRLRPFQLTIAIVLVLDLLVTWTVPVAPALAAAAGLGVLRLRTPRLRRRLTAALEANAALAGESRLAPVRIRLPGDSWLRGGRRRRRASLVLGAVLALLLYVLVARSFFVPTSGR